MTKNFWTKNDDPAFYTKKNNAKQFSKLNLGKQNTFFIKKTNFIYVLNQSKPNQS